MKNQVIDIFEISTVPNMESTDVVPIQSSQIFYGGMSPPVSSHATSSTVIQSSNASSLFP
jgi:hypothetical protein